MRMAVEKFGASERFACKVLGQNRSALRKARPVVSFEEARLRAALRAVAGKHPAWGWRKALTMFRCRSVELAIEDSGLDYGELFCRIDPEDAVHPGEIKNYLA